MSSEIERPSISSITLPDSLLYIYEVRDEEGNRYRHCGQQKDADYHVMHNPGYTWERIPLGRVPRTVDVHSQRLQADKALPQSDLYEFPNDKTN
tara:strand:+ start:88 stop:369 length:282 start_codon:yes stop_codon:yes gene_type:complete